VTDLPSFLRPTTANDQAPGLPSGTTKLEGRKVGPGQVQRLVTGGSLPRRGDS